MLNSLKNFVSPLRGVFYFDFSRCRYWLLTWWFTCLVVIAMSVTLVTSGVMFFGGNGETITVQTSYLIFLILVGLIFQPAHPGLQRSFFRGRPVSPRQVLVSRWCFVALFVLLPHFLSQLAPLLLVDFSFDAVSAFSVYYWGVHLGVVAVLGALATASKKMSSYLLRSFFGGALLLGVASATKIYSGLESNWIYVTSPEAGRLLWVVGICLFALFVFVAIMGALYRGRGSWRLAVVGIVVAILLAAALQPVRFLVDVSKVGELISEQLVSLDTLSFKADRQGVYSGYYVQRNRGLTGSSTSGLSSPPYWKNDAEEFWFIRGEFEIEGLDPELAYSARLLEARWVSDDGDVVEYDPPTGTNSVRNLGYRLHPPIATTAGIVALLGEPSVRPKYFYPITGKSDLLLFGAWTSVYERFKTTPGRLELRVRVDFYRHDIGQRIPLSGEESEAAPTNSFRLRGVASEGGELEARVHTFAAAKTWGLGMNQRRGYSSRDWVLYDPKTKERAPADGFGSRGSLLWQSVSGRHFDITFQGNEVRWNLPDVSHPELLELIHLEPRYLGSAVVEVTTEDFRLVTKETIERAE